MKFSITSISHQFTTSKASNMFLSGSTLKTISSCHTLSTSYLILIWSTKITSSSTKCSSTSSSNRSSYWLLWCFLFNRFASDMLYYISWIKSKNIFFIHLLKIIWISFIFRVIFQKILNDTIKRCIFNSSSNLFSTFYTISLFIFN
jgi:hypothetical protein